MNMAAQRCSARKWSQDANSGFLTVLHWAEPQGRPGGRRKYPGRDAGRVFLGEGRAWSLWKRVEAAKNGLRKREEGRKGLGGGRGWTLKGLSTPRASPHVT